MGNYLDRTYAALDGVLLSYVGGDIALNIPQRLANMDVTEVGDGAFMNSGNLQQVVIPPGVKRIGRLAFAACENLMNVYIPGALAQYGEKAFSGCDTLANLNVYGVTLSERGYNDLRSASAPVNGTRYLARIFPDIRAVKDAAAATDAAPATYVPDGIGRLFTSLNLAEDKGAASLSRNLDGLSFGRNEPYATETDEFARTVASYGNITPDRDAETKNDAFLRTERFPAIKKSAVFTFDDAKTKFENGKYSIFVTLKIGYHFWQSCVPLVSEGKTYYVYRRHYLSSEPGLNYVRKDAAVFSEDGAVVSGREAKEVYAKYKLLCIL